MIATKLPAYVGGFEYYDKVLKAYNKTELRCKTDRDRERLNLAYNVFQEKEEKFKSLWVKEYNKMEERIKYKFITMLNNNEEDAFKKIKKIRAEEEETGYIVREYIMIQLNRAVRAFEDTCSLIK